MFDFWCFLALSTETSFTTPHYYQKYEAAKLAKWRIELQNKNNIGAVKNYRDFSLKTEIRWNLKSEWEVENG